uniref:Uncharacterized protein n=1 Tax=Coccidioides posadasii RMSCC 3488 TaxID=454284 RepID=A0A0J6FU29_COCPO|nr:hypothetical protein CPAG_09185 [Coccidioides posadasii RMSCC 3488]
MPAATVRCATVLYNMCSDGYVVNARDYVVCGDWCPVEEPNDEIGIVNAADCILKSGESGAGFKGLTVSMQTFTVGTHRVDTLIPEGGGVCKPRHIAAVTTTACTTPSGVGSSR